MNTLQWWLIQNLATIAVLIVIVSFATRFLRNRPAVVHALWLLVLIKFVTPPIVHWPWTIADVRTQFYADAHPEQPDPHAALKPLPTDSQALPSDDEITAARAFEPALVVVEPTTDKAASAGDLIETASPVEPSPLRAAESLETNPAALAELQSADATPSELRSADSIWSFVPVVLLGLWILGAVIALLLLARRLLRQNRLVVHGKRAPASLRTEVESVARTLRVSPVRATIMGDISAPFLWCLGRLRLVWPQSMLGADTLRRSRGVIAHELAHVRRRDHWVAWLELTAAVIWWWNPLFWFVRRRLRESAEMACDAVALSVCDDRRGYAELFLELSSSRKNGAPAPVLGVSTGTPASFERRLTMILSERVSGKLSLAGALPVITLAALVLPSWTLAQRTDATARTKPIAKKAAPVAATPSALNPLTTPGAQDNLRRVTLDLTGLPPTPAGSSNRRAKAAAQADPLLDPLLDANSKRPAATQLAKQIDDAKRALNSQQKQLAQLEAKAEKQPDQVSEIALLRQQMKTLRAQLAVESLTNKWLRQRSGFTVESRAIGVGGATVPRPATTASRPASQPRARFAPPPAANSGLTRATTANAPAPLAALAVSSDPEQQELQEKLLALDLTQAHINLDLVKRDYDRLRMLADRNVVSSSELAKKQASLARAKYDVERSEIYLQMFKRQVDRLKLDLAKKKAAFAEVVKEVDFANQVAAAPTKKSVNNERLKERLQVLIEIERLQQASYKSGETKVDSVLRAKQELLAAKLELATNAKERKQIQNELIDAAAKLEAVAKAMYEAGQGTRTDILKARAFRLRIEAEQ